MRILLGWLPFVLFKKISYLPKKKKKKKENYKWNISNYIEHVQIRIGNEVRISVQVGVWD
jgi:hypothetical protein